MVLLGPQYEKSSNRASNASNKFLTGTFFLALFGRRLLGLVSMSNGTALARHLPGSNPSVA